MLEDSRQLIEAHVASAMPHPRRQLRLMDLVVAVAEESRSQAEVVAVVAHLIESGAVKRAGGRRSGRFVIDRA